MIRVAPKPSHLTCIPAIRARAASTSGFALLTLALLFVSSEANALDSGGLTDGDACTIDRNGLKIPGKVQGLECCSVLDTKDCVVILKPFPTNLPTATPIQKNPPAPKPTRPATPIVIPHTAPPATVKP